MTSTASSAVLVGRLARKRPSPLARADTRIWAAGAIYAVGRADFLFDPSQQPHLSAHQLAHDVGVVKTTMANKAALITKTLDLGIFEPDLTRLAMLEQHPLTWMVMVNGFIGAGAENSIGGPPGGVVACGAWRSAQ